MTSDAQTARSARRSAVVSAVGSLVGSLTARGWVLACTGVVVGVIALALAQRDLLRVAVLLLALPALALLTTAGAGRRLTATRTAAPSRVGVGEACRVVLTVANTGRRGTGPLLGAEHVDGPSAGPPRFVLEGLAPGVSQALAYTVRPQQRGRQRLGPLRVRVGDPLGLCETTRTVPGSAQLLVFPVVETLRGLGPLAAAGGGPAGGAGADRGSSTTGESGTGTREYRVGDDLRRVHWRSTARHGDLMVRLEEQTHQRRAHLLLDVRPDAHLGRGPRSSFEAAVSATASVAARLLADGFWVQVHLTEDSQRVADGWLRGAAATDVLLEALADVTLAAPARRRGPSSPGLLPSLTTVGRRQGGAADEVLVVVTGRICAADAAVLAEAPVMQRRRLLVLAAPTPAVAVLPAASHGWRVLEMTTPTSGAGADSAPGRACLAPAWSLAAQAPVPSAARVHAGAAASGRPA